MIRSLYAFAWLRWRLLINSLRGTRRRDTLEMTSRWLGLLAPLLIVALSMGSVLLVSVAGFVGGRTVATEGQAAPAVILILIRVVLAAVSALVLFLPIATGGQTNLMQYTRLLLLPIPRRAMHMVEVLAGLVDPWLAFVLPGLVLFAVGLAIGGRIDLAVLAAAAGAGLAAVLALLGSIIGFLVTWLLRDRRRGEMFTLLFVLVISAVSLLPTLLGGEFAGRRQAARDAGRVPEALTMAKVAARVPGWTIVLPSELYARAMGSAIENEPGRAWLYASGLFAEMALLYVVSFAVHRQVIAVVGTASRRRRASRTPRMVWIPGCSPITSAVAIAQARSALRSVRGRLAVLLPGPMMAILPLVISRDPDAGWARRLVGEGPLTFGAALLFGIYALQAFTMNQFAADRAGLTLQWLSPISAKQLVWGKAIGCGLVLAASAVLSVAVALVVAPAGSPWAWLAVLVAGIATFVAIAPVGAWMSALFPVAADLSKTGSGGNPHGFAILVGMFFVLLAAAPPAAIIATVHYGLGRSGLALGLTSAWLVLVLLVAIPLLNLSARAVTARRENLALVASGR